MHLPRCCLRQNTLDNLQKVYDKNEILVLSPITNGVVEIYNQEQSGSKINKLNFKSEVSKQEGPFFSTIKSFKGLEFHTIVIVDVDIDNFIDIRDMNSQLYTAISRGLETVSLHITKDALKLLQEKGLILCRWVANIINNLFDLCFFYLYL